MEQQILLVLFGALMVLIALAIAVSLARDHWLRRGWTEGWDARGATEEARRLAAEQVEKNKRAKGTSGIELDFPDEERIDLIGHNGNSGDHYQGGN